MKAYLAWIQTWTWEGHIHGYGTRQFEENGDTGTARDTEKKFSQANLNVTTKI